MSGRLETNELGNEWCAHKLRDNAEAILKAAHEMSLADHRAILPDIKAAIVHLQAFVDFNKLQERNAVNNHNETMKHGAYVGEAASATWGR